MPLVNIGRAMMKSHCDHNTHVTPATPVTYSNRSAAGRGGRARAVAQIVEADTRSLERLSLPCLLQGFGRHGHEFSLPAESAGQHLLDAVDLDGDIGDGQTGDASGDLVAGQVFEMKNDDFAVDGPESLDELRQARQRARSSMVAPVSVASSAISRSSVTSSAQAAPGAHHAGGRDIVCDPVHPGAQAAAFPERRETAPQRQMDLPKQVTCWSAASASWGTRQARKRRKIARDRFEEERSVLTPVSAPTSMGRITDESGRMDMLR
mgnify:CR=1 FL=1